MGEVPPRYISQADIKGCDDLSTAQPAGQGQPDGRPPPEIGRLEILVWKMSLLMSTTKGQTVKSEHDGGSESGGVKVLGNTIYLKTTGAMRGRP